MLAIHPQSYRLSQWVSEPFVASLAVMVSDVWNPLQKLTLAYWILPCSPAAGPVSLLVYISRPLWGAGIVGFHVWW